jgi:Ion channel
LHPQQIRHAMAKQEYRGRHLALLISILLLIVISPFAVTFRHGILVLNILGAGVLVAGSYALSERRYLFITAIFLSAISISATSYVIAAPSRPAIVASHATIVVLVSFFSVTILGYVLHSGRITTDRIFAAICVYLLIAYAWTFAYAVLEELVPGSFGPFPDPDSNDFVGRVLQLRYFSFMTLTTVGYGDILPRSPTARTMAIFESVMGQLYLAVLVARLVGLHIVHTIGIDLDHKR